MNSCHLLSSLECVCMDSRKAGVGVGDGGCSHFEAPVVRALSPGCSFCTALTMGCAREPHRAAGLPGGTLRKSD